MPPLYEHFGAPTVTRRPMRLRAELITALLEVDYPAMTPHKDPRLINAGDTQYSLRPESPVYSREFIRAPYAPTPLNPYSLNKDKQSYFEAARQSVDERFAANLNARRLLGTEPNERMVYHLRNSVHAALADRFNKQTGPDISPDCEQEVADLYEKACLGMASASELIDLLIGAPEIIALELAKFSHPFEWLGKTVDIDITVENALRHHNAEVEYKNPEYYISTIDNNEYPETVVVVRKVYRGKIDANGNLIHVIQRDMFVVNLGHSEMLEIQNEFSHWLKNKGEEEFKGEELVPYGGVKFLAFLNDQIDREEADSTAIEPGVCSYYAFRGKDPFDDTVAVK